MKADKQLIAANVHVVNNFFKLLILPVYVGNVLQDIYKDILQTQSR